MPKTVYAVWYDNGEAYEDAYRGLSGLFTSKTLAEDYIESRGYTECVKDKWQLPVEDEPDEECVMGLTYEEFKDDAKECYSCSNNFCDFDRYLARALWDSKSFMTVEEVEVSDEL